MSLINKLELAENVARQFGNLSMFQRDYINARQMFGVQLSIEMALDKQDLIPQFNRFLYENHDHT